MAVLLRKLSHLLGFVPEDAGEPRAGPAGGAEAAVLLHGSTPSRLPLSQDGRIPHPHPAPGCYAAGQRLEAVTDRATLWEV